MIIANMFFILLAEIIPTLISINKNLAEDSDEDDEEWTPTKGNMTYVK